MKNIDQQIEILSKTISKLMEDSGISKNQIANKTGLSVNTINNCTKGQNINLSSLLKITSVLGMNIKDFVNSIEEDLPQISPEIRTVSTEGIAKVKELGQTEEQIAWKMGKELVNDINTDIDTVTMDNLLEM
tara:strand:- start:567 stop:962 length:396 start_codon:yes stop_codon:yes gene_type:complete